MVFLFFFGISFGFWLLQKLDDTFEAEIEIPLQLTNIPRGVMITTPLPDHVVVTVRDRGTQLVQYMRNRKIKEPLKMDFSLYDTGDASGHGFIPIVDVQHVLQSSLLATTHVLKISPDTLEYYYNRGQHRTMSVKLLGQISTQAQNYLQYVTFQPDSVTVYAPEAVLDTMRHAYTEAVMETNLGRTKTWKLKLEGPRGVKFVPDVIDITAHVDIFTEQSVMVPVIGTNFPADKTLRTFPSEVKLTYRVGAANAKFIKPESFVLTTTYEELQLLGSDRLRLHLKSLPIGVSNVRIEPQEVDYLIEQSVQNQEVE